MEKGRALIFSFVVTLVIYFATSFLSVAASATYFEEEAIGRAIDGDTIELANGMKVRLVNINSPELGEKWSSEAKAFLSANKGKMASIEFFGIDRYGRALVSLEIDGKDAGLESVGEGLAHIYLTREEVLEEFIAAQEEARALEKGIWKKSKYYGCIEVEIYTEEETAILQDNCKLDKDGWKLKDEGWRSYEFTNAGAREITVYSRPGIDSKREKYWGREGSVWDRERNSVFVYDEEGLLVYYDSYGY